MGRSEEVEGDDDGGGGAVGDGNPIAVPFETAAEKGDADDRWEQRSCVEGGVGEEVPWYGLRISQKQLQLSRRAMCCLPFVQKERCLLNNVRWISGSNLNQVPARDSVMYCDMR